MEYSVFDLIRILIRKWYVIVITMAVIAVAGTALSRRSYEAVQESYEAYTTQTIPADTVLGSCTATYQCTFRMKSYDHYQDIMDQRYQFLWGYTSGAVGGSQAVPEDKFYAMADEAYAYASADFQALLTGSQEIFASVQSFAQEQGYQEPPLLLADGTTDPSQQTPLVVADHLTAALTASGLLSLTTTGLTEEVSTALMSQYIAQVQRVAGEQYDMTITAAEQSYEFTQDRSSYTDDALLSQTVMAKPETAPSMVRAAASGAAFGFVFSCFGILLFTFIKESRSTQQQAGRSSKGQPL